MMSECEKETVVVAGASGFIGRALPESLGEGYELVGLTRTPPGEQVGDGEISRGRRYGQWRSCDLFSRWQAMEALEGATRAIYLVHSMRPSARLTQGNFRDMDLICADNFARAASRHGIKHIVYLSEIIPRMEELSDPLASRLEVEETLGSYGTPVTTLRAGLVLGAGGSGTEMIVRLVERLPVMGLPKWTRSKVAPIARGDVADLIAYALEHPEFAGASFDIGGPDVVTYRELLERTAQIMGKKRYFFDFPVHFPHTSSLWVSVFSGQPRSVVYPTVESFLCDHTPADQRFQEAAGLEPTPLREAIAGAIDSTGPAEDEETQQREERAMVSLRQAREVRSVQRLPLPPNRDALWVAREYARWLPQFMRPFIRVDRDPEETLRFFIRPLPWPLLVLAFDADVSHPERQLYWIRGGFLATPGKYARLEFREVLNRKAVMAAIHQFKPRLPWLLYVFTQAVIHGIVMYGYGRYLARLADQVPEEQAKLE